MVCKYMLLLAMMLMSGTYVFGMNLGDEENRAKTSWKYIKMCAAAAGIRNKDVLMGIINDAFLPSRLDYRAKIQSYLNAGNDVQKLDEDRLRLHDDNLDVTIECQHNGNGTGECWSYRGKVCPKFPGYFSREQSSQIIGALEEVYKMQNIVTHSDIESFFEETNVHNVEQEEQCWNHIKNVAASAGIHDSRVIHAVISEVLSSVKYDYLATTGSFLRSRNDEVEKLSENRFRIYDDKGDSTIECQRDNDGREKCCLYKGQLNIHPEIAEHFSNKESARMIGALEDVYEMQKSVKKFLTDNNIEKNSIIHKIRYDKKDKFEEFYLIRDERNPFVYCYQNSDRNCKHKYPVTCKDLVHNKPLLFDQYSKDLDFGRSSLFGETLFHVLKRQERQKKESEIK